MITTTSQWLNRSTASCDQRSQLDFSLLTPGSDGLVALRVWMMDDFHQSQRSCLTVDVTNCQRRTMFHTGDVAAGASGGFKFLWHTNCKEAGDSTTCWRQRASTLSACCADWKWWPCFYWRSDLITMCGHNYNLTLVRKSSLHYNPHRATPLLTIDSSSSSSISASWGEHFPKELLETTERWATIGFTSINPKWAVSWF